MAKELRVIPLGGLGEFGMNMLALESGDDMILIDAGILFPSSDDLGINAIVPDLSYVLQHRDKLRGLVLTHGHLDHIGGVPYLLEQIDLPIYGTAFTLGLVRKQLSEFTLLKPPHLVTIRAGQELQLGCFGVEGIHVTHSTLQCLALAISTPVGYVLHTGDFKVDQTPVDGRVFDFEAFADYGKRGVQLLLADSTNSDVPGFSDSERSVGDVLDGIFSTADGALFFTCFSSAIHRVQQVVDRAVAYGRKLAMVGRSLDTACHIAMDLGLLRVPAGTLVDQRVLESYPRRDRVTLIAGSQGEPRASLTRAALGKHRWARIEEGDIVGFSAKMIPGNEKPILKVVDNLHRLGAKVLYGDVCPGLHVSGHPCREELKLILNLVRPKYFVPIHGEYRQLAQHRALAREVRGEDIQEALIIENGSVLHFDEHGARVLPDRVPVGRRLIDSGTRSEVIRHSAVRERHRLAEYGVIIPVVTINGDTGRDVEIEILDRGFAVSDGSQELLKGAHAVIKDSVKGTSRRQLADVEFMEDKIRDDCRRYLARKTDRQSQPVILPILLES